MKYKLGEICKIVSGTTPKTSIAEYWDGDIKWLTPAEIKDDSYTIYDTFRKITLLGKEKSGLNLFPKGTVILSSRAPIGKVAIAGCDMCCNQGFKNLICSEKVYNKYLYWFLKTKKDYLNSLGRGATFKEISKQIVSEIIINLPSYNEQGKIVDKLERLQKIVAIRKQQLLQLDKLIKALFIEMFGDPIENKTGWRTIPLLETGQCKNGINYSSKESGVEMHCLGVADFQDNTVIDDMSVLPVVSLKESPNDDYLLQDGDIVFVRSNGNKALVGRSVVVYPGDEPVVYSGFCIRYRKESEDLLTDYLLRFFKTDSVRAKMAGRGANIQNLNQQILAALNVPIPSIELQKEFSLFVKQSDKSK